MIERGEIVQIKGHEELGEFIYHGLVVTSKGLKGFAMQANVRPVNPVEMGGMSVRATDDVLVPADKLKRTGCRRCLE